MENQTKVEKKIISSKTVPQVYKSKIKADEVKKEHYVKPFYSFQAVFEMFAVILVVL